MRSSLLAQDVPFAPYGHSAHLALALVLYAELSVIYYYNDIDDTVTEAILVSVEGPKSRWWGYLQSLPSSPVDIALFWGSNNITLAEMDEQDSQYASLWMEGTELKREFFGENGVSLLVSNYPESCFIIYELIRKCIRTRLTNTMTQSYRPSFLESMPPTISLPLRATCALTPLSARVHFLSTHIMD